MGSSFLALTQLQDPGLQTRAENQYSTVLKGCFSRWQEFEDARAERLGDGGPKKGREPSARVVERAGPTVFSAVTTDTATETCQPTRR